MQKITTLLKKTDTDYLQQKTVELEEIQISEKILQNILQFAAVYRVEPVNENQYIEMFLN